MELWIQASQFKWLQKAKQHFRQKIFKEPTHDITFQFRYKPLMGLNVKIGKHSFPGGLLFPETSLGTFTGVDPSMTQ